MSDDFQSRNLVRDPLQLIGLMEGGELAAEIGNEVKTVVSTLRDLSGHKKPKKGSITIKLEFEVEEEVCHIEAEVTKKMPKRPRPRAFYFVTGEGDLSRVHPRQLDMFSGPREVAVRPTGVREDKSAPRREPAAGDDESADDRGDDDGEEVPQFLRGDRDRA